MSVRDACRFINDQGTETIQMFITRMEFRGKDATFTRMRDDYLDRLALQPTARVLELG